MILLEIICKAILMALAGCAGAVLGFYLTYQMIIHGWLG
ncbi:hypothetical protein SEA_MOAB_227 [Streptomyces phage Moab]|nr:hypothetical protein SEA_MOAB_227 [Streptomyces phage Moab]WMI33830.1 membrane protein [Streptomyces phage Patelgo]